MTLKKKSTQKTQELENKQLTDLASQTSSPKEIQSQSSVTAVEQFSENQTGKLPKSCEESIIWK